MAAPTLSSVGVGSYPQHERSVRYDSLPMNSSYRACRNPGVLPCFRFCRRAPEVKRPPTYPLSLDEIQAWIDRSHPLLKGAGTEKVMARGKMLKALGAFEPTVVNDTELERFISSSDPNASTQTVGFNDTLVEARHP